MPRRTINRCQRNTSAEHIDHTVEINLVRGECFGIWDLPTAADFARHWRRWGDEILARWIKCVPGSRPMALYVLGEIEPPTWTSFEESVPSPLRRIPGSDVVIPDVLFHRGRPELDHLRRVGVVDRREAARAVARLREPDGSDFNRYRALYWDRPEPRVCPVRFDDQDE